MSKSRIVDHMHIIYDATLRNSSNLSYRLYDKFEIFAKLNSQLNERPTLTKRLL